ncbi:MAG: NAD(P)H-hydrate dehydratase, partial [Lachnospiraceae bacterium]|nr:NAD(P)H-hydrate dehydratase [Lachnospiraceae bacterium]
NIGYDGGDVDSINSVGDLSEFVTEEKLDKYTVIIDAIFGIGLSREITGMYQYWITWINCAAARVVSVDIPSGIHASTGMILGVAVQADQTITFGVNKRGLLLYPGTQHAGEIVVADIGFPKQAVEQVSPKAYTYHPQQISPLLPLRKMRSHKGSYGKVLVIAGSPQMSGACYFASEAAYRVGAGLVQILTAQENAQVLRTKLPEAIVSTWSEEGIDTEIEQIHLMMDQASAIVIGPGIGQSDAARKLVKLILEYGESEDHTIPIVIDADGLNLLAGMEEYFTPCEQGGRKLKLGKNMILTPHFKEMSRLIQQDLFEITRHMVDIVEKRGDGCTIVLKDARTLVSDGRSLYINTTGNSALAKGGSGDVLSGMIGGFLAQGMKSMEAASLAVCLHGMTADAYVENRGIRSMLASDILAEIPRIMR